MRSVVRGGTTLEVGATAAWWLALANPGCVSGVWWLRDQHIKSSSTITCPSKHKYRIKKLWDVCNYVVLYCTGAYEV